MAGGGRRSPPSRDRSASRGVRDRGGEELVEAGKGGNGGRGGSGSRSGGKSVQAEGGGKGVQARRGSGILEGAAHGGSDLGKGAERQDPTVGMEVDARGAHDMCSGAAQQDAAGGSRLDTLYKYARSPLKGMKISGQGKSGAPLLRKGGRKEETKLKMDACNENDSDWVTDSSEEDSTSDSSMDEDGGDPADDDRELVAGGEGLRTELLSSKVLSEVEDKKLCNSNVDKSMEVDGSIWGGDGRISDAGHLIGAADMEAQSLLNNIDEECMQDVCGRAEEAIAGRIRESDGLERSVNTGRMGGSSQEMLNTGLDNLTAHKMADGEVPKLETRTTTGFNPWRKKEVIKLAYFECKDVTNEGGTTVLLEQQDIENNKIKLEKALVGRLLGRRVPYHFLLTDLRRKWSRWGDFKLILLAPDCFMCIFESVEARDAVLMNGPWFLTGNIIGLDKWSADFDPDSMDGFSSPVWVRLPKLPLLYWDNNSIARIAAFV